jgi:hypothetical protein
LNWRYQGDALIDLIAGELSSIGSWATELNANRNPCPGPPELRDVNPFPAKYLSTHSSSTPCRNPHLQRITLSRRTLKVQSKTSDESEPAVIHGQIQRDFPSIKPPVFLYLPANPFYLRYLARQLALSI